SGSRQATRAAFTRAPAPLRGTLSLTRGTTTWLKRTARRSCSGATRRRIGCAKSRPPRSERVAQIHLLSQARMAGFVWFAAVFHLRRWQQLEPKEQSIAPRLAAAEAKLLAITKTSP